MPYVWTSGLRLRTSVGFLIDQFLDLCYHTIQRRHYLITVSKQMSSEIKYEYYHGLNLFIGLLAMLMNGFLLIVLTYLVENRRQTTNVLIINQTSMDLLSSIGVIVTYAPNDFTTTYSRNGLGYAMCLLFHGSMLQYTALYSSVIGLTVIAGERYVKIVHSILHRKHYRPWMIYCMVAMPWVCSASGALLVYIQTTVIIDLLQLPGISENFCWYFV